MIICNRRAFVLASGCPQVVVNLSFPDLDFCSTPEYTEPTIHPDEQPPMSPQRAADANFNIAPSCINLTLSFSPEWTIEQTSEMITHTGDCFSGRISGLVKIPCFRHAFTESTGKNNGTSLIFRISKQDDCGVVMRVSSKFSFSEPSRFIPVGFNGFFDGDRHLENGLCVIPSCVKISLYPIIVGYGSHDADNVGNVIVNMGGRGKLDNNIIIQFPLMCDLPPDLDTPLKRAGARVSLQWQWNKSMKWRGTAKIPGPCSLREIHAEHPVTARCLAGVYILSLFLTKYEPPDPNDFRGSIGKSGPIGPVGPVGRDASQGDIGDCPDDLRPREFCEARLDCDCHCDDPDVERINCHHVGWELIFDSIQLSDFKLTLNGFEIMYDAIEQRVHAECPGNVVIDDDVRSDFVRINAPVMIPTLVQ